jgi:isopentenyl-diphosphate delta-isomerase
MEKLIVVDKKNRKIGIIGKEEAHTLKGILHRAFSVFVVNKNREVLLQKRSKKKRLWPLFWSNTCCSHPRVGEKVLAAAKRRLKEELGFSCPLKFLFKFDYRAVYKKAGSENEMCYVFWGGFDGKVKPRKDEIENIRWVSWKKLLAEIKAKPKIFTPWLKMELKKIADESCKKYFLR